VLAACALLPAGGCFGGPLSWFKKPDSAAPKGESVVLAGGKLEKDDRAKNSKAAGELEAAKELYAKREYAKAEPLFAKLADNKKNTAQIQEEARYFQADCQRLQSHYPDAVGTYKRQLKDYPTGAYQQQAVKQMFDIADYWLNETRQVMQARAEQREGKRNSIMPVMPVSFVHFDKTKPFFDMEGEAGRTLEEVYVADPAGPLAARALWYLANIRMLHEDWRDADYYFGQIVEHFPNDHDLGPRALEMQIICKEMAPGGPEYDPRQSEEARKLVMKALSAYPELKNTKSEFLMRQQYAINEQQAARDFGIAAFYERTKHPGAAYFEYEIVRRRYPNSKYAQEAEKRMNALRVSVEQEQQAKQARVAAGATPTPAQAPPPSPGFAPGTPMTSNGPPAFPAGAAPGGGSR
jgi:outer membrane protein assembly factor BamD (BamD/ComL family)